MKSNKPSLTKPITRGIISCMIISNCLGLMACQNIINPTYNNISSEIPTNKETTMNTENRQLVLIHGIHQSPLVMMPLAKKLTHAGFLVYSLNYPSLFSPLSDHSEQLNQWLLENHDPEEPLYLVGHSLGGLVIRDFVVRYPQWKIANIVTLGTPHQGSITADYTKKILPFMVGKAYKNGLDGNVPALPADINLGIIAGNTPIGLGTPFIWHCNKDKDTCTSTDETDNTEIGNEEDTIANDGTVYIYETKLDNATAHIILPVTHTGMLINEDVAKQAIHFLEHSKFIE